MVIGSFPIIAYALYKMISQQVVMIVTRRSEPLIVLIEKKAIAESRPQKSEVRLTDKLTKAIELYVITVS